MTSTDVILGMSAPPPPPKAPPRPKGSSSPAPSSGADVDYLWHVLCCHKAGGGVRPDSWTEEIARLKSFRDTGLCNQVLELTLAAWAKNKPWPWDVMVKEMIEAGADPSLIDGKTGMPALHYLATIIDRNEYEPSDRDAKKVVPDVFKMILGHPKADINQKDRQGWTVLMYLANNGWGRLLEMIIDIPGLDLTAVDARHQSARSLAVKSDTTWLVAKIDAKLKAAAQAAAMSSGVITTPTGGASMGSTSELAALRAKLDATEELVLYLASVVAELAAVSNNKTGIIREKAQAVRDVVPYAPVGIPAAAPKPAPPKPAPNVSH